MKYKAISGESGESDVEGIAIGERYCTMSPERWVTVTVLPAQSSWALYLTSQSMPKMTSRSVDLKDINVCRKDRYPMQICTSGVTHLVCQLEPGVFITNGEASNP